MFDINKQKKYDTWVEFPDAKGERYKISYWGNTERLREDSDRFLQGFYDSLLDWDGIGANGKLLPCTDENKKLMFETHDSVETQKRMAFLMLKMQDVNTFLDTADYLKNLKAESESS